MTEEKKEPDKEELYEPMNITKQGFKQNTANAYVSFGPDKIYNLLMALKLLISDPNIPSKKILKEYFKEKYPDFIKKITRAQAPLGKCKAYYDQLTPKQILTGDIKNPFFKEYVITQSMIPLIDLEIIEAYSLLLSKTTLKNESIGPKYWSEARKKYKSFEIEPEEQRIIEKKQKEEDEEYEEIEE